MVTPEELSDLIHIATPEFIGTATQLANMRLAPGIYRVNLFDVHAPRGEWTSDIAGFWRIDEAGRPTNGTGLGDFWCGVNDILRLTPYER